MINYILVLSSAIVLLLLLTSSMAFLNWREKRRQHEQIERLLDDVTERQQQRAVELTKRLMEEHGLAQTDAESLSDHLLASEKRFLREFIMQRLRRQSLEHFYQGLCELLDQYMNHFSTNPSQSDNFSKARQDIHLSNNDQNWGDVFD